MPVTGDVATADNVQLAQNEGAPRVDAATSGSAPASTTAPEGRTEGQGVGGDATAPEK